MILGIGIDLVELKTIKRLINTQPKFSKRILTLEEYHIFQSLPTQKRQIEFLGGRYAGKEAFSKALGTGIGPISFQDISIVYNASYAPYMKQNIIHAKTHISISHTNHYATAQVILEDLSLK